MWVEKFDKLFGKLIYDEFIDSRAEEIKNGIVKLYDHEGWIYSKIQKY